MNRGQEREPWQLPPILLAPEDKRVLEDFFSPPINIDLAAVPRPVRNWHVATFERESRLVSFRVPNSAYRKKVATLKVKALAQDERAFLELVALDPRYLCSDLGLLFICRWQRRIDSDPMNPAIRDEPVARLDDISRMLRKPFDSRGKRRKAAPKTSGAISACYYAALKLFEAVNRLFKQQPRGKREMLADDFRRKLAALPAKPMPPEPYDWFLLQYVCSVDAAIGEVGRSGEFSSHAVLTSRPSDLAADFVTTQVHIKERAIRERLHDEYKRGVCIHCNSKNGRQAVPICAIQGLVVESFRSVLELCKE